MKYSIINKRIGRLAAASLMILFYFSGCKPEQYPITTNPTLNIIQYFDTNPDYSIFDRALIKTGYAGFLGAYGRYTVFAPNNTAMTAYLQTINKSSVDEIDDNALKDFVSFHIVQDTLSTLNFTDGKLPTATMFGLYITTGAAIDGGITSYVINKQAKVIQPNIRTGNGLIHTLDHVLLPPTQTIAQILAANPKYSIFSQALTATGYYDTLNVVPANSSNRPFLTVIAQTDSVFNAAGITSFADLKAKYSTTGNPKNPNDSLFLYVAYRIIPSLQYLGDIVSSPSQTTLAPQENLPVALINSDVILNQVVFNGILEVGVPLDRVLGDVPANNGVIQSVKTNFKYKVRQQAPVYFDVTDQPELRKATSVYKKVGATLPITTGLVSAFSWEAANNYSGPVYTVDGAVGSKQYFVNNDYVLIGLRLGFTTIPSWFETVTPLIVKGTYKVWICYRNGGSGGQGRFTQVSVDGQTLGRIVDFGTTLPSSTSSRTVLESQGYKRYIAEQPAGSTTNIAQLAGVVTITSTDVHRIRFTCIKTSGGSTNNVFLDMIQFIPTSMSQTDKCMSVNGNIVNTPSTFP
ncbi:fasciclin domain-containing protein [Mucilaginibacter sp. HMF5004]|uniref:fasciclin domain-containing protein n=1 Tax=Mucilaginibacter rivuli TaxID=2857527 RepID=UPI001C5F2DBA|nr:fasciclin domain-containing protein [Mucilaginibacter rivuli]MBW4888976.1 fasciclin domain-containing protein [Mucilaginibacter rivuli]